MKGIRRSVVHHYPYYGYGYGHGYPHWRDYYRRPADPPFIIVKPEDKGKDGDGGMLNKINWPTVGAALLLNALLFVYMGGRDVPRRPIG